MTSSKGRQEECGNFKMKTDLPLEEPRLHERLCSNPEIKKKERVKPTWPHLSLFYEVFSRDFYTSVIESLIVFISPYNSN